MTTKQDVPAPGAQGQFKGCRIVETFYDDKCLPYCNANFTEVADRQRLAMFVYPDQVIPVIFLPGIMGSNLRLVNVVADMPRFEAQSRKAWRPDEKGFATRFFRLNASERRRVLSPDNTQVDVRGDIDLKGQLWRNASPEARANWTNEYMRRGWGSVFWGSYGELLCELEFHLNRIFYQGQPSGYWHASVAGAARREWGTLSGHTPLTAAHLTKAASYWYPVHAVGYNWTQSNAQSGHYVARMIDHIMGRYIKQGYQCQQVLLVTHSMGGLAARAACSPQFGNAQAKVLGVVHGEQPAIGAAAAYKRCHAGFEGALQAVLGRNGPEVAAVFSNSPGALQLLPSKLYGSGWLRVVKPNGQVVLRLPDSQAVPGSGQSPPHIKPADPYAQIYARNNVWWQLIDPAWLDPTPIPLPDNQQLPSQDDLWKKYIDNLSMAKDFHEKIGTYYHPKTHSHYGVDEGQRAWGDVVWRIQKDDNYGYDRHYRGALIRDDDKNGKKKLNVSRPDRMVDFETTVELQDAEEPGDGTVPQRSAQAAAQFSQFSAAMTGYDHQGSYANPAVIAVTMYSLAMLAQQSAI